MFHHWPEIAYSGPDFRVLGVNRAQISIFHFITRKNAHPCAIPRLLSHCASKSVQGSLLYIGLRKKNKEVTPLPRSPRYQIWNKRSNRGLNQSIWDETQASRGSQEIASCLLRYCKTLPTTVNHITAYSDYCGEQNRNENIALTWMYIVQSKNYTVRSVDHKFFLSRDTLTMFVIKTLD